MYCDKLYDLPNTIDEFLNEKGPVLCEFKILSEICVPLVKPGCALDDMLLYNEYHNKKVNMIGEAPN